jgi:membrane-associated PAP2 superfamily phosphatase
MLPTSQVRVSWWKDPLLWGWILVALGLSLLFRYSNLDLMISAVFYQAKTGVWVGDHLSQPWAFLAENLHLGIMGVWFSLALSCFLKGKARVGFFMLLLSVVASGLIVNTLKDYTGRPRPEQIEAFGGPRVFQALFDFGLAGRGKSFASGHATIGFLFVGLWFVFREARPRLAQHCLFLGIVFGILVGLTRIASGKHFTSDVMWAGLIVWICAWILTRISPGFSLRSQPRALSPRAKIAVYSLSGLLAIGALFFTLLLKMQYNEIRYSSEGTGQRTEILQVEAHDLQVTLRLVPQSGTCSLRGDIRGFGWPQAKITSSITTSGAQLRAVFGKNGYFSEYSGRLEIHTSATDLQDLQILLEHGSIQVEAPPGTQPPPRWTLRVVDPQAPKPKVPADWVLP